MRQRIALVLLVALMVSAAPTSAQDRPRVGILKLTSSAPIFVGVEKGFFKEFGVEPELVYFQAAAPIATLTPPPTTSSSTSPRRCAT